MKRFLFVRATLLVFWLAVGVRAAERESITVCAYNLKNFLSMERFVKGDKAPDQPKPEKEIVAIVKFLTEIKPDVLGVSEIGQEKDLLDRLKKIS